MNNFNYAIEPEIQEYLDFMNKTDLSSINMVKKERIKEKVNEYGKAINTFLTYPDILVDLMTPKDSKFSLFFLQRMVLRTMARHRQSFHTFTRGFSKSFLADLSRYVTTMLVPRHKAFIVAGTKQQAAQIAKEKVIGDLWVRFPLLKNEMKKFKIADQWRNAYVQGTDYAEFRFTHGGIFDVVGGTIRGYRRHSGIFEEVIELDQLFINETVIPLLNKPREDYFGRVNPKEPHGSKIYITTAGFQGSFAYDKLIETLCYSVIDPDNYMVLGGSYKIPLMHGLLQKHNIEQLLSSPTFAKDSFDREYNSIWSGAPAGSAFTSKSILNLRKIVRAEYKAREGNGKDFFYVVTADMAKDGSANTAVIIYKVKPGEFSFNYSVINLFKIDNTDYEKVSNILKKTVMSYDARLLVYDAQGIGAAIRDWLNKDSKDENGLTLRGLNIINPPTNAEKDVIKWRDRPEIAYEIKSAGEKGEQIHQIFFSRISNGSVRFLIKSNEALQKFSELKGFKEATNITRERKLRPYFFMDQMENELKNLEIIDVSDTINKGLKIKRRDAKIQKDFFSAAEYGVYAVNLYIESSYYKKRRKKLTKASDWVLID